MKDSKMCTKGGVPDIISATFLATASNLKIFFIYLYIYLFSSVKDGVVGQLALAKQCRYIVISDVINSLVSIRVFINLHRQENKNKEEEHPMTIMLTCLRSFNQPDSQSISHYKPQLHAVSNEAQTLVTKLRAHPLTCTSFLL